MLSLDEMTIYNIRKESRRVLYGIYYEATTIDCGLYKLSFELSKNDMYSV